MTENRRRTDTLFLKYFPIIQGVLGTLLGLVAGASFFYSMVQANIHLNEIQHNQFDKKFEVVEKRALENEMKAERAIVLMKNMQDDITELKTDIKNYISYQKRRNGHD